MRRDYCASGPSRSVTEAGLSDTDRGEAPQERRESMHMGFWTRGVQIPFYFNHLSWGKKKRC